ncbi:MAG TPA: tetratricopeptide repeat protein, partial [Anaerolineales bacterium]|nr:tetratricopeptide repeat protein [Anaerolineales bacterium]
MAQQYPDAMPALLARHHEIVSQSIQAHDGYIFQIVGDAFCAAFHSPGDALDAALAAQRSLCGEAWSPAPVRDRMGIHTGAVRFTEERGYSGYATLALTQRIMSAGHGGQILLSAATRELVRDALPAGASLLDLGEKRLKDLLRPERLYQLNAPGLPANFPPLKTLDRFPNNLPVQLTTFIGREHEIREVRQALDAHRLVTLTGSGGTGKSRLSLQVAAELLDQFDHGVWFVELASLADPELIPQTILATLGVNEQQGLPPLEVLKEYLHGKKALLVLDNCEHLVSASARAANALLNAAPGVKILASSREALGVDGELSYPVPSLTLPDIKHLPLMEHLSQYEAVRLFIDRASLVAPHFEVDKENAPFIAQICYRLDGIPLAIELAAARVKVLSVEQISRRLDDRFRLLTGGARTALPRQQTLRALIDWSYDILSEGERLLLCRLSVFAGSWTLEAAEEVCADEGVDPYEILDLLTQLVNKSLVPVIEHAQSGETRYRMLETIRQYAREKLLDGAGSAGVESLRQKHLAYFVKLTEQAEPELLRSNQVFWLNRLEEEVDNLRLALEWALTNNVQAGLWIVVRSSQFWSTRGYGEEFGDWLPQLLERHTTKDSLHVRAMATYCWCTPHFIATRPIAEEALQLARELGDRQVEAFCLMAVGVVISLPGNLKEGIPFVEQSRALYRALGDRLGEANAMTWLILNHNDLEQAKTIVQEGLALFRELGHLSGIAVCLIQLAHRTIWGGDFTSPVPWLEEARMIFHRLGDLAGEADTLNVQGSLAYWQGDYAGARSCYGKAISLYEKAGIEWFSAWSRANLAYALLRQGEPGQAGEMFRECIRRFQKTDTIIGSIYAIEGLASLHVSEG